MARGQEFIKSQVLTKDLGDEGTDAKKGGPKSEITDVHSLPASQEQPGTWSVNIEPHWQSPCSLPDCGWRRLCHWHIIKAIPAIHEEKREDGKAELEKGKKRTKDSVGTICGKWAQERDLYLENFIKIVQDYIGEGACTQVRKGAEERVRRCGFQV